MCNIRSPPAEYSITKHTCSGVWKQPKRFTRKGCPALVTAAKIRFSHIRLEKRQKSESPAAPPIPMPSRLTQVSVELHCCATLSDWILFSFWEMGKGARLRLTDSLSPCWGRAWEALARSSGSLPVSERTASPAHREPDGRLQWHQDRGALRQTQLGFCNPD